MRLRLLSLFNFGHRQGTSSQPSWNSGVGGDTYPYEPSQQPYPEPGQGHQPAYYDPNASAGHSSGPESSGVPEAAPVRGYDVTSSPRIGSFLPSLQLPILISRRIT